ncbi:MAG: hypothetical protein U1E78_11055 [Gammaproteobacteria bacterium]
MPIILLILNSIALIFAFAVLVSLPRRYLILFLVASLIPLIISALIAIFGYDATGWGLKEIVMLLLRGGFILSVVCGALACFIATKLENKEN